MRLPDDEAIRFAKQLDVQSLHAVRPGSMVSLEISIQADPAKLKEIRLALTDRLVANGLTVVDAQPLKLVATTTTGETHPVTYVGKGRETTTVTATDQISSLQFLLQGETIWKAERVSGAPYFVRLKDGQNMQQAVNQNTKPDLEFFTTVRIPARIAKPLPVGQRAFGRTFLTRDGQLRRMPAK